jgi:quinol monooxygenase YgiN
MHARIGTFDAPADQLDNVATLFRDKVVPEFARHDGFIGYQGFIDRGRGRFVGISLWATQAALEASSEAAKRAREEAAKLGAVTVGEPQVLEQVFDSRSE